MGKNKKEKIKRDYGKTFSRIWWGNFWYYHRMSVFIAGFLAVAGSLGIYVFGGDIKYDTVITYMGEQEFAQGELDLMNNELIKFAVDLDNNGEKKILFTNYVFERDYYQSAPKSVSDNIKRRVENGECAVYLVNKAVLDFCAQGFTQLFEDVSSFAKETEVAEEDIFYHDNKAVAISLQDSDFWRKNGIAVEDFSGESNMYLLFRKRREGVEDRESVYKAKYDHGLEIAKYLISGN